MEECFYWEWEDNNKGRRELAEQECLRLFMCRKIIEKLNKISNKNPIKILAK